MIDKHIIRKIDNKEELILFLDFDYELGSFKKGENDTIKESIKNYIKTHHIKFNGEKILLTLGGIAFATLLYTNNDILFDNFNEEALNYSDKSVFSSVVSTPEEEKINPEESEEKKEETKDSDKSVTEESKTNSSNKSNSNTSTSNKNNTTAKAPSSSTNTAKSTSGSTSNNVNTNTNESSEKVTIYRSNGSVVTLDLEEYVIGVVAAEMPASFNKEALKAQSILARTYAIKSKKNNKKLTDTVSTQAYIDKSQMKSKWGSEYEKYYNKIKDAVNATKGMYVTYNNQLIDAVYHSTSNGKTEDAIYVWGYSVPYLKSVDSSWDKEASSYLRTVTKDSVDILKIFGIDTLDELKITKRNSSGRVVEVMVGDEVYSGVDIRTMLSLRSTDFDIEIEGYTVKITTRGYGHGVGMSQYGANIMANKGSTYKDIIHHYYTNIEIKKL